MCVRICCVCVGSASTPCTNSTLCDYTLYVFCVCVCVYVQITQLSKCITSPGTSYQEAINEMPHLFIILNVKYCCHTWDACDVLMLLLVAQ